MSELASGSTANSPIHQFTNSPTHQFTNYQICPAPLVPTVALPAVSIVCVTDAELVERARQGDAVAFGELVDRHRSAVYRAALAALRSPADAEDAAQDAFLTAYRRLSSFRGESSFKTWLLTIAWHQAINQRRGLKRWWRLIADSGSGEGDPGIEEVRSAELQLRGSPAALILVPSLADPGQGLYACALSRPRTADS